MRRSDTESQRPEGAVRGGVAVPADDGHTGLREPHLRSHDVYDSLMRAIDVIERDAELLGILP